MIKKMRTEYAVYPSSSDIHKNGYGGLRGGNLQGHVQTKNGFVAVYAWRSLTLLEKIVNGKLIRLRINKKYSKRYLVTLAKRFAAEGKS